MSMETVIENSLYFLALINPASKVFLLSSLEPKYSKQKLLKVSMNSTFIAMGILMLIALAGNILLKSVFHVELYSLKVAGGIVLFIIGLTAVRRGVFFEKDLSEKSMDNDDITIVPLAAPLIVGPGIITAAISFASEYGVASILISITIALAANFLIMLSSSWISNCLEHIKAIGPLIRITGLIVAAVAIQMIFGGVSDWISNIKQSHEVPAKKIVKVLRF